MAPPVDPRVAFIVEWVMVAPADISLATAVLQAALPVVPTSVDLQAAPRVDPRAEATRPLSTVVARARPITERTTATYHPRFTTHLAPS